MSKSPVQTVKKFEREVQKRVAKVFPRMVENEARKILDAGQPKSVESTKPVDHGGLGFVQVSKLDLTLGSNSHEPPDPLIVTPCKRALEVYGSKVKAARALGIAETTFRDRLKKELASGPA